MNSTNSLHDRFGRRIDYLRLSVTDRCDLRCSYCMPAGYRDFSRSADRLSFEEIGRIVRVMATMGLRRVRLSGGEPLLRRDLSRLAALIAATPGIVDLSLSTNGTRLAAQAAALRAAGVSRLNVSLDTLRAERFRAITGHDALDRVLHGLEAAAAAGFAPIKINMVVLGGVNDDECEEMAAFCLKNAFVLRLIEKMPLGATAGRFVDLQPVRQRLEQKFGLVPGLMPGGGPARYLRSPDGALSIGFITPVSQHFCEACNRIRFAADGTLYLCLGEQAKFELRPLLRSGASDETIEASIRKALDLKPWQHSFLKSDAILVRPMARTGG